MGYNSVLSRYIGINILWTDYIVQGVRFQVWEEIGCGAATIPSVLSILLINVLPVLLPAFSALFYCREYWVILQHLFSNDSKRP